MKDFIETVMHILFMGKNYGCENVVSALGLEEHFSEKSELFKEAVDLARKDWRNTNMDLSISDLYIRRVFVQKARKLRDERTECIPIDSANKDRFDRERTMVRGELGNYALQTETNIGWDPARWRISNLGLLLPQTKHYVLTLADAFLTVQDDGLKKASLYKNEA